MCDMTIEHSVHRRAASVPNSALTQCFICTLIKAQPRNLPRTLLLFRRLYPAGGSIFCGTQAHGSRLFYVPNGASLKIFEAVRTAKRQNVCA